MSDGFTPAAWQERYRTGHPVSGHAPSPLLVAATEELAPGRALDAGCGRGANAVWLASRGWEVTGVDVSDVALADAAGAAAAQGSADRTAWVQADLTTWTPGEERFDLVTCLYVHLPEPLAALVGRLAGAVAPGGTLLVVGHAAGGHHGPGGHHDHPRPPGADTTVEEVAGALPADGWRVLRAGAHVHEVARPGGGSTPLDDVVLVARRATG